MLDMRSGIVGEYFVSHGIDKEKIFQALLSVRGNQKVTDQNPENKYQALENIVRI
jgi:ATP-dependent Clp protease ATP-binding subunit ClpB